MSRKTRPKNVVRYSESFKMHVIRQIEESGISVEEAKRKYGISGGSTIQRWIKKYGKHHLMGKKVIVMKAEEQSLEKRQSARIKELESALVRVQLEKLASESYLEIACEELGVDPETFKKKEEGKP